MADYLATLFMALFPILGILALVWLHKVSKLFSYLSKHHPEEYAAMGKPNLISNNTFKTNFYFLKLVLGSRASRLGDDQLVAKCVFLRRLFFLNLLLFAGVMAIIHSAA